jgi:heme iron utilization protein
MASEPFDATWAARCLLRAARVGTLATSAEGHPFASLVTPACAPDLSVLMLLSRLSPHTRHLMADGRCSILVVGMPETANPQTAPRVTVTGIAKPVQDAALKARYLAIHPYASLYANFGDFGLWRMIPAEAQMVGGFGRAKRLKAADLLPDAAAVATILAAEDGIIGHCNQDHPHALAAIAGTSGGWQMVTVDTDGFDLAQDEQVRRFAWSAPVKTPDDVRAELVRMAQAARAKG